MDEPNFLPDLGFNLWHDDIIDDVLHDLDEAGFIELHQIDPHRNWCWKHQFLQIPNFPPDIAKFKAVFSDELAWHFLFEEGLEFALAGVFGEIAHTPSSPLSVL